MENYEELLHKLEEFERMKMKELPKELEEFIIMIAKNGDPVYPWPKIRHLYRAKIINVLNHFFESSPLADTSQFSFDSMKSKILERYDTFRSAPFTIQRLSELLINPRKEYNRIDKYMRAIEKNLLVVSVVEPGCSKLVQLNGSIDTEEGFPVTSTLVYDDYRQRVAGLMEHEVAAASISEDEQTETHNNNFRCKQGDDGMKEVGGGDVRRKDDEGVLGHISCDNGPQARLGANQGLLDHQEFHRLEFSLVESDTLAIVEIVSEVDCPPEDMNEDSCKDYPLDHSMMDSSTEVHDPVPVMPDVDHCDTVTEVISTDTCASVPTDEGLAPTEKDNEAQKDEGDNLCPLDFPSKSALPLSALERSAKLDCSNVDVMDIGTSGAVPIKMENECSVDLNNSNKVLVISSPVEPEFPETINRSPLCRLEETDRCKGDEFSYLGGNRNESASEYPPEVVVCTDMFKVESVKSLAEDSQVVEEKSGVGEVSCGSRTLAGTATEGGPLECQKEELMNKEEKDNDS